MRPSNLAADPRPSRAHPADDRARSPQWQRKIGDDDPLRVANPKPKEIDMTAHRRNIDRWQPMWIVEKYWPDWF